MKLTDRQVARLLSCIDTTGDCWEWTGPAQPDGSGNPRGSFFANYHRQMATRAVWRFLVGPLSDDTQLDHLCRNTICVNPDHLEPVSHRVNQIRGFGPSGINARKTRCNNGHRLAGRNLYVDPRGYRVCRTCLYENIRRWRAERRAS